MTCRIWVSFISLVLLSGASTLAAQDGAQEKIVAAIKKLSSKERVFLSGRLVVEDDGQDMMMPMLPPGMDMMPVVKFTEKFDVVYSHSSMSLVAGGYPGFVVHRTGKKDVLTSLRFRDVAPAVGNLSIDLMQVLDLSRLATHLSKAKKFKETKKGNNSYVKCNLPPGLIQLPEMTIPDDTPPGMPAPPELEILWIGAKFTLNSSGDLTGIRLTIERSNPMAEMMENMGGGGGQIPPEMLENPVDEYEFTVTEKANENSMQLIEMMSKSID